MGIIGYRELDDDRPKHRAYGPRHQRGVDQGPIRMGIDELAATVGLTTRTIRSYQARGLLPSPGRIGRTPFYGAEHLARLRLMNKLQRRGLSLDAIRALLEPELVLGESMIPWNRIAAALRQETRLINALVRYDILTKLPGGGLAVNRARAILACVAGNVSPASTRASLWTLVDAISELLPLTETILARLHSIVRQRLPNDISPEQTDELAMEVLRACLAAGRNQVGPDHPPSDPGHTS